MNQIQWFVYREYSHSFRSLFVLVGLTLGIGVWALSMDPQSAFLNIDEKPFTIQIFQQGQEELVETLQGFFFSISISPDIAASYSYGKRAQFQQKIHHPQDWSATWNNRPFSMTLDGQSIMREANRIQIVYVRSPIYRGEVLLDQESIWQKGLKRPILDIEHFVSMAASSPKFLFWLVLLLRTSGQLLSMLWFVALLFALNALAHALNSERNAGTLGFYKSLPFSDFGISAVKFLFHSSFYPLCALVLSLCIGGIGALAIAGTSAFTVYDSLEMLRNWAGMALDLLSDIGKINRYGDISLTPGIFFYYFLAMGVFYLTGSIVKKYAFLYPFIIGVFTLLMLERQDVGEIFVRFASVPWYGAMLFGILWNVVFFGVATAIYRHKEF